MGSDCAESALESQRNSKVSGQTSVEICVKQGVNLNIRREELLTFPEVEAVDSALDDALKAVHSALDDVLKAVHGALDDALKAVSSLEEKVSTLEEQIHQLYDELNDLKVASDAQSRQLENEISKSNNLMGD